MAEHITAYETPPQCKCGFCGEEFKNMQAIRSHLHNCKRRAVLRYYICNEFVFGLLCNPAVKFLSAIEYEIKESGDPKLVMGAIRAYTHNGYIKGYFGITHTSKLLTNGAIPHFKKFRSKITEPEMALLIKERTECINNFKKTFLGGEKSKGEP